MLLSRLAREPLIHFVLIGLALFGASWALRSDEKKESAAPMATREARPARISVTAEIRRGISEEHVRAHARPPTAAEMDALVARWVDEEVLYREGLARGLDQDDPRVRVRVAEKMSFVLESSLALTPPTEAELAAWFAAHLEKWAQPALVDFTQVFVQGDDTKAHERARELLARLEKGADPAGMGDVFSGGRRYRRRKMADLAESFGADFTAGMSEQKEGTWALRRSRFGFHLVRIDRRALEERPDLTRVRAEVEYDWTEARRVEKVGAAIAELRKRWVAGP